MIPLKHRKGITSTWGLLNKQFSLHFLYSCRAPRGGSGGFDFISELLTPAHALQLKPGCRRNLGCSFKQRMGTPQGPALRPTGLRLWLSAAVDRRVLGRTMLLLGDAKEARRVMVDEAETTPNAP